MKKTSVLLGLILLLGASPLPAKEKPSETDKESQQLLQIINAGYGKNPIYDAEDVKAEDRHAVDLNGDGAEEMVIVPFTSCGETKNCEFFILGKDKKNGWRLLLRAQGKVTTVTPWGYVAAPHKTQGYPDIIAVMDMGPEANGTSSLERHIYVFNGNSYEAFEGDYPPAGAGTDLLSLMKQVEALKYGRRGK